MTRTVAQPPTDRPEPSRLVLVLAAFAAVQAFARTVAEPVGADESAFLSLLVGGVLAAIAAVAPRPAWELGWTALSAVAAIWIVGYGPHRGAVVTVVLAAGLAVAAARAGGAELMSSPGAAAALALGFQLLLRCDLLLPPLLDLRTLVSVLALPVAAGIALSVLAGRFGAPAAWAAGVAAVVLAPGWNVTVTLAVVSLAAGAALADRGLAKPLRALAAAALAVPPLWDPALGTLFVIAALTLLVEGRASWLLTAAGVAVLVFVPPARFGRELLELWALGPVLAPAVLAAPAAGRVLVLRGAFLSLVAAMLGGGAEVLAGGLALAALGTRGVAEGVASAQRAWGGALALAVTALAAYPWLREEPLAAALELFGLGSRWAALAAAVGLVVALGWGLEAGRRRGRSWRPPPALAAPLVCAALALALARAVPVSVLVPISFDPVILTGERAVWFHRFAAREIAGGIVDCNLIHGTDLPVGTRVASLRLRDADGALVGTWELLAGLDTAEWAAARPDVAGRRGFRAPDPWLAQIAPGGTFFAQRFRSRFELGEPVTAAQVAVRRDGELPADVELVIYRVELRE
jgi:hypothetical protein